MRALMVLLVSALAFLAGCGGPDNTSSSIVTPTPTAEPAAFSRPTRVKIPSLQVDANIIDLGLQADGKMQVPPDAEDAGWYVNSPSPGAVGRSVIAAHVNWKGVDGPFAKLSELKAGDEITVKHDDGTTSRFVVDRVETHSKDAFPAEEVYGDTDKPELVAVTCGGDYDAAAHSYRDNIISWAHLAN